MKLVYSDQKSGKSAQAQLDSEKSAMLMNRKINEIIDGALIGLQGYKLKITGGSDSSGFPMNKSINSGIKARVLRVVARSGKSKGMHKRSTVRGNTITQDIELVNTVIVEYGEKPASEIFPENSERQKAKEEKKEAKK